MLTWAEEYGPGVIFVVSSCMVHELIYGAPTGWPQFVEVDPGSLIIALVMQMVALSYGANLLTYDAEAAAPYLATKALFESHKRELGRFYWAGIVIKSIGDIAFVVLLGLWLKSTEFSTLRSRVAFLGTLLGVRIHMASVNVAFVWGVAMARRLEQAALGVLTFSWWACAASLDWFDLLGGGDPMTRWFAVPLACYMTASLHRLFLYDLPPRVGAEPAATQIKAKDSKSKKDD
jgi:hypothetical protein